MRALGGGCPLVGERPSDSQAREKLCVLRNRECGILTWYIVFENQKSSNKKKRCQNRENENRCMFDIGTAELKRSLSGKGRVIRPRNPLCERKSS